MNSRLNWYSLSINVYGEWLNTAEFVEDIVGASKDLSQSGKTCEQTKMSALSKENENYVVIQHEKEIMFKVGRDVIENNH